MQSSSSNSSKLESAMRHATRGWLICPSHNPTKNGCSCGKADCRSPGEHPRTPSGIQDATAGFTEVDALWSKWKDANILIVTGIESGIVVLRIDEQEGGAESLSDLEWQFDQLPEGPRVNTGKGFDIYFAYPETLPAGTLIQKLFRLSKGIDVCGDGGYVLGAGSVDKFGKRYGWRSGLSPQKVGLPDIPDWLINRIIVQPARNHSIPKGQQNPTPTSNVLDTGGSADTYTDGSIDELLMEAGFNDLSKASGMDDVELALRTLAALAEGMDTLRRAALQQAATTALADAGVGTPRRLVDAALKQPHAPSTSGQGSNILFGTTEPWPDPVDGDLLLKSLRDLIRRYLVLPRRAATAISLWILHTHAIDVSNISPFLAILSPEPRCGKTVLMELLLDLVHKPLLTSNITPAALFRIIDKYSPTLLIDEADTFFKGNEDLRGILNSGHRKPTAKVTRTVGKDFEPRVFSTWGPKAIARIGKLELTLEDRSITIPMKRKAPDEHVSAFHPDRIRDELSTLRMQIVRWVIDHLDLLKTADPTVPSELNDRAQDNWGPLLAIADTVGGPWPKRARLAAIDFSGPKEAEDSSSGVQMLADIRQIFSVEAASQLATDDLLRTLNQMEDRPWPEWRQGKPMTPAQLARLLGKFGIHPKQIWINRKNFRGYVLADFEDAFRRYLPPAIR
jgi:hypothetical protein